LFPCPVRQAMQTENAKHFVLIIDDDHLLCEMTRARHHIDVVLLDQKLPDGEGGALCQRIINFSETAKIIFITAYPSFKNALQAIENGAFSYLTKPFELKELKLAIDKCLRINELEKAEESIHYQNDRGDSGTALIGATGSLASIQELIRTSAGTNAPVLLTGETGTGKSLVARLIHQQSQRRGPFMAINCAALPENLIESELFGHEKGSFSGAHTVKKGLLEIAENGSILLDEIGEMGFHLQAKLLGMLDEMQIRRIGGVISHPVQVRIMAATNILLEHKIKTREFREDLYYRLNVIRIHLPPLRERQEDIPLLAASFLREMAPQRKLDLSAQDLKIMIAYPWPGNVRELRNVIERAIIHTPANEKLRLTALILDTDHEPLLPVNSGTDDTIRPLAEIENRYIALAIKKFNNNFTQTAKALGISLNTLKKKAPKK
jgi:DNA-binding NtrC family response regulator